MCVLVRAAPCLSSLDLIFSSLLALTNLNCYQIGGSLMIDQWARIKVQANQHVHMYALHKEGKAPCLFANFLTSAFWLLRFGAVMGTHAHTLANTTKNEMKTKDCEYQKNNERRNRAWLAAGDFIDFLAKLPNHCIASGCSSTKLAFYFCIRLSLSLSLLDWFVF